MKFTVGVWLVVFLSLVGCGKGSSDRGREPISLDAVPGESVMSAAYIPPGELCPMGGTLIKVGFDKNNNKQLDDAKELGEISESFPVCNGLNGLDGSDVRIIDELPGENCIDGGIAIFKVDELLGYICNGVAGLSGDDAASIVLDVLPLAKGLDSECVYGGEKLVWGQDSKPFDGILQDEEIIDTLINCNPSPEICNANITIRAQEDLEPIKGCYTSFTGNLVIDGPITSLSELSVLETITGNLVLQSSSLTNIGLEKLKEITGDLFVSSANPNLSSLAGLESLQKIGGTFTLMQLPGIKNFTDLTGIEKIGTLNITSQNSIENFVGLEKLSALNLDTLPISVNDLQGLNNLKSLGTSKFQLGNGGNLKIADLSPLSNLEFLGDLSINPGAAIDNNDMVALGNLKSIGNIFIFGTSAISDLSTISPSELTGSFKLQGTGRMEGLRGFFKNIISIPGSLQISDQQGLKDLSFLNQMESIGGSLSLQNNPLLTNFSGLGKLKSIGAQIQSTDVGMNIINGPTQMCGLKSLESYKGVLYHSTGTSTAWELPLALPQAECPN